MLLRQVSPGLDENSALPNLLESEKTAPLKHMVYCMDSQVGIRDKASADVQGAEISVFFLEIYIFL